MRSKADRILEEALSLPETTRVRLAGKLFESVDIEGRDSGWEAAWAAEIGRRVDAIDAGDAKLIPWSQVRRDIMKSRREPKGRKVSR